MVYLGLIAGFIVIAAVRVIALAIFTMHTATSMHGDMLTNIFRTPLSFFESSPIGRTMSRFSRDIEVVDVLIPANLNDLFLCLVQLVIAVLASAYFVPIVMVPFVILAIFAYRVQHYYRSSARELQRLENIHRSPVLSHVTETLAGLASIRAFGLAATFEARMGSWLDEHSKALYAQRCIERWLGVRMEGIAGLITVTVATVSVIYTHMYVGGMSNTERRVLAGVGGMSLAYSLSLPGYLNWLVRQVAETEARMNSVERIRYYAQMQTEDWKGTVSKPDSWPDQGGITLKKLTLSYRPHLAPALHDLSFQVKPGQKVGICGRTGAGKSTLLLVRPSHYSFPILLFPSPLASFEHHQRDVPPQALFRILEVPRDTIEIDGQDTRELCLDDLRASVTIIPQVSHNAFS
jgi:ABC-type multidrug transport system fused ATPase/permease subunit